MNPKTRSILLALTGLMALISSLLLAAAPTARRFVSLPPAQVAELSSCCELKISFTNADSGTRLFVQTLSGPHGFDLPPVGEVAGGATAAIAFPAPGVYTLRLMTAGREGRNVTVNVAAENALTSPLIVSRGEGSQ